MAEPPALASRSLAGILKVARRRLLRLHFESRSGHLGGNLSALPILIPLYHGLLGPRDVLVLSKGHAAGALYVALWSAGRLGEDDLVTFHGEGTLLAGHPVAGWHPDIVFTTGSLGHGLSLAAGLALWRRFKGQPGHVFCLTSDGEWQEGSTWEGLIFAAHHRLDNLTVVVDANGLQAFGTTAEVASLGDLGRRLAGFEVGVRRVSVSDLSALAEALRPEGDRPRAVVIETVKGLGVSFMENQLAWHYLPLTPEQYQAALAEVGEG
jgi:transketolase